MEKERGECRTSFLLVRVQSNLMSIIVIRR